MKKAIFIILFTLPIFLMITISIAGRLIVMYIYTPVESIHFETVEGEKTTEIEVGKNKTIKIITVVLPELASNKKVVYTPLTDEENPIFIFNEDTGEITGLRYGVSRLIAITDDKNFQEVLEITVTDKNVSGITLNKQSLVLNIGDKFQLSATIAPETALNRNVTWNSSNPSLVSVSIGEIIALEPTPEGEPVSITVTTEDGGFTAVCTVTVLDSLSVMAFYRIGEDLPFTAGEIIVRSSQTNLMDFLRFDDELIALEEITFEMITGQGVLSGQTVTFNKTENYIKVRARVVRDGEVVYSCEATFRYRQ